MTTRTGQSISTALGGELFVIGNTVFQWCGGCGCTMPNDPSRYMIYRRKVGDVPAGTYALTTAQHRTCPTFSPFGALQCAAISNTNFDEIVQTSNSAQYLPGSIFLELIEANPIPPNQPFDCLNGGCIPKATYNTPGVFPSLAACQLGCAKNSNCAGECVSPAQMADLQSATANLIARYCP